MSESLSKKRRKNKVHMEELNHVIPGSRTVDDKELGQFGYYNLSNLCYINMFKPKKNYLVPQYHTNEISFTDVRTFEGAKKVFPHLVQLDSGLLVNLDQVEKFENTKFGLIAHFYGGLSREIAKNKIHLELVQSKLK